MTKRRAERLTGYEVRRLHDRDRTGRVAYGAFLGEELIAEGAHFTDELALKVLVREVYRLHALEVLRQCDGRCARCRKSKRLQIHHRQYRSHGGTHRIENLEPVCWDCHHLIHKLERSK
jgi:hypothetical protein